MERYLKKYIQKDLERKMVFLAGPRQVGKTTLAKHILELSKSNNYLNWDTDEHKKIILKKEWDRQTSLVVFDELHKFHRWKNWIKGVYDNEGNHPAILVTGSARLDIFRKHGDSLTGRYYHYRLHPLSIKELESTLHPEEALTLMLKMGNFPYPLLTESESEAKRWRKERMEKVIHDDLISLESIRNLSAMELLVDLLRERVGSPLSIKSLSEDLHVSPHTVSAWIDILERLYVIFKVKPYSKNVKIAIKKEYKIYFMDIGEVQSEALRFENLIASHLLKYAHFKEDIEGDKYELRYLRDKEKREVDFCLVKNNVPELLLEVKLNNAVISPHLIYFKNHFFPEKKAIQVTQKVERAKSSAGCSVIPATQFLLDLI